MEGEQKKKRCERAYADIYRGDMMERRKRRGKDDDITATFQRSVHGESDRKMEV